MRRVESFRDAFARALVELGELMEELVVVDADVASSTKTILFAKRFPTRFVEVGISEQDMVGVAAGLAVAGMVPLVSTFSMFLLRAWEQIRNLVARGGLNVKFAATHAGLSDYLDGPSHQCLEDIAVMRVITGMKVVVPADAPSTKSLLRDSLSVKGPVYMRLGRDYAPRVYDEEGEVKLGKANVLRDGSDVCIAACGVMVRFSLEAAKELEKMGISTMVMDVHTIEPLDKDAILKASYNTKGLIVVEEHSVVGGLGGAIAELLAEKRPTRIVRVGVKDSFGTCSRDYLSLLNHYGLSVAGIVKAAKVILNEG
ncbi:MAG: transketolase family protein [Candidatus Verstraetearchaeota archaeon]|nr:transketolase family protein [Candidatus Verstraetearchaeota archaeon]